MSDPIVHILSEGFAVCGKPGVPGSWEPGHVWVRANEEASEATCPECIARAAPHRTGKPVGTVSLTGMVMPWNDDEGPVLLGMPRSSGRYLPCFSSPEALWATMNRAGIAFTKIKIIEDGAAFLSSIPRADDDGAPLHVIADPYFTEDGLVRFKQVFNGN